MLDSNFGSSTARAGFRNEEDVACSLNNWKNDELASLWLNQMGFNISLVKHVEARVITRCKTDVTINITDNLGTHRRGFQVKLVSNRRGYNQIDKRWVRDYADLWQIPIETVELLKLFTGEKTHSKACRDGRRMFLDEFNCDEQVRLVSFFENNKRKILNTLFLGVNGQEPDWYLVIQKNARQRNWSLTSIEDVINYYGSGNIEITPRGSLTIGKITMQRKGGDGGRPTANMLQFKINPAEIMQSTVS